MTILAEIVPSDSSDIIVGHHLGGWFAINRDTIYSLATLFKNLLTSEPNVPRVLVPEMVRADVFIALKGLFSGDEVEVLKEEMERFIKQLRAMGIKVRKLYQSSTLVVDDQPMVIAKRLSKVWLATILWPRSEELRAKRPKIKPYYSGFPSSTKPIKEVDFYKKDELRKWLSHYKIRHHHGDFQKYIYCIGPTGSFRIKRQVMKNLSALKYNVFNCFAGDMNFVFFPAQTSALTFRKFELLMLNGKCQVPSPKFKEFVSQLALAGISVGVDEGGDERTCKFRILANPSKKSRKMICKLNNNFEMDPSECKEGPVVELIRLTKRDIEQHTGNDRDSQSEEQGPPKKRKC